MTPSSTTPDSTPERPLVVVVDDDVPTLDLLREIAEAAGWRVVGLTRLAALRPTLEASRPELLILDDDLPDGRGGDLAQVLHDDPQLEDLPVLVCTAAHPMRQAEIGAWAPVVSKPFDLDEIEAFLHAAVDHASGVAAFGQAAG